MMRLTLRSEILTVARLEPTEGIPLWAVIGQLFSVSRTDDELSVVCADQFVPRDVERVERGWRALQLEGPIPFGLSGILASVLDPLAAASIGIFAISTFDTDYVLVRSGDLDSALDALQRAGHVIL